MNTVFRFEGRREAVVCDFRYRIGAAPGGTEAIRTALRDNIERKLRVQPVRSWSAGASLKPPGRTSAGKLLDEAGFLGQAARRHVLFRDPCEFLVNEGGAGSADAALELIRSAQSAVWERFGIQLQTEVKLWVF